jgi:dTDP-4-dehydrorhamnose reductase
VASGTPHAASLELWGGIECTVVRVGEEFHDQFQCGGHHERADEDLERVADLGIRTLRYPVSWERVCPDGDLSHCDWEWIDARMEKMRELGIRPIVGLVHHGGGPRTTSLIDPEFPEKLARFAAVVAERYPWVTEWTPVNEPLTTARFSGMYGHWYPHGTDVKTFSQCLLNEVRGTVLAMRAIRERIPGARLVQTEDMGKTYSTPALAHQAAFENERRWLSFDLLTGRLDEKSQMWLHLIKAGISGHDLRWFAENPCPPDIMGINHYLTSERFLDERLERYPEQTHGGNGRERYADVEAVRVLAEGCAGVGALLREAWERYGLPLAITEAHLGCTREEQMRWLVEVWNDTQRVREEAGADVRAVTVWSLFGAVDWDSLLTLPRNSYEPGVFDVRGREEESARPRDTGLTGVCRALAQGQEPDHPVLEGLGWWRRPERLLYPPESAGKGWRRGHPEGTGLPLLITGASGALGAALVHACTVRGLPFVALGGRKDCDIADPEAVERALKRHRPWAVVNAAGYVSVAGAEAEEFDCFRANVKGPAVLARACAVRDLPLIVFSSAMVFDGSKAPASYAERDAVRPSGVYARSKAQMEKVVRREMPGAMIVRSSALFGPWDTGNFLTRALQSLAQGETVYAASDEYLTPAYLPDFANRVLDLLIDGESGIWHLGQGDTTSAWKHPEPVSRGEIIRRAAEMAGLDGTDRLLRAAPLAEMASGSAPCCLRWAALASERSAPLLPSLDSSLRDYVEQGAGLWKVEMPVEPRWLTPRLSLPRRAKPQHNQSHGQSRHHAAPEVPVSQGRKMANR